MVTLLADLADRVSNNGGLASCIVHGSVGLAGSRVYARLDVTGSLVDVHRLTHRLAFPKAVVVDGHSDHHTRNGGEYGLLVHTCRERSSS